jgi:hypothetical protein
MPFSSDIICFEQRWSIGVVHFRGSGVGTENDFRRGLAVGIW